MTDTTAARRKELLERRLREQNLKSAPAPARPARDPGAPAALSPAQRRMWFVQNLSPDDTTLNVCVAYRLTGPIDAARLRAAIGSVVADNEILRTVYGVDDSGEPFQVSRADVELPWQQKDVTGAQDVDAAVAQLADTEFGTPFDLAVDVPIRATLVTVGADEHVLILVIHHVGWDDASWPAFFAAVNAAYRGDTSGPIDAQYVDVVADETPAAAADLAYWREYLTPLPERLALPGVSATDTASAARTVSTTFTPDVAAAVAEFARTHGTTPFVVQLAAFEATLHRYTAATDFLVSVPVVNRGAAAQNLIGYFGNTVLLRADVTAADSFDVLVDKVRSGTAGGFAHQQVGVDEVVREVSPQRTDGRDAIGRLVQVSFSNRSEANGFALDGVVATELPLHAPVAAEELGLLVVSDSAGGRVEATYRTAALEQGLVEQFLDHYVRLLEQSVANPATPLRDIDILGAQREQVIAASHGRQVPTPASTIVDLFARSVAAAPEREALVSEHERLTYADLNARANRLAHWMIGQGVGAEDIVALRLATSVEFVVGTLAIAKAGGAYLPIDPAYPAERIDYLRADARPVLELDAEGFAEAEKHAATASSVDLTDADRLRPLHPANIAYVIYTSGSTGQPKGVPVPHNAIAEHLEGFVDEWALTSQDRVLQSTSVSFDASLLDIYVTLTAQACVVVPRANAFRDIAHVADIVSSERVTVLHMVPSMLATLLALPEAADWTSLRHLPVGGEALAGEVAQRFATQFDAHLRNHYGPTEAVVSSTHMDVDGPAGGGIVPIGVPNQNVTLYVLDDSLGLVPDGVAGEIYLGGEQLARGYLDRPGLTAGRFIADPFTTGGRLYRSGDVARRNAKGDIEFLGRADEQVKVRGFRIELGEVGECLSEHEQVAHAFVIVVEHPVAGPSLVGYVVAVGGAQPEPEALREHVAARLPEHMVPASVVLIDEVPLTAHGKLDRRALPEPELSQGVPYREPANSTQQRVAGLFAELFAAERVGADDSFFDLGGHSMLAARLITMIRTEFGVELDLRVPFDNPTVTALAGHLAGVYLDEFGIDIDELDEFDDDSESGETGGASEDSDSGPGPVPTPRERPEYPPLSYSQRAYWLQRRMDGAIDGENVTFPIRLEGPLDRAALFTALADVVERHESLRTTFPEHEGNPYQLVHPVAPLDIPVIDIGSEEELDEALDSEARYVFDLTNESSLRLKLLVVGENDCVLSILMHHIIADRSSCEVFVRDLITAYRSRVRGTAPAWPAQHVQFIDFAIWQREVFDRGPGREVSPLGESQLDFWRAKLAGLPEEINVGHDFARPPVLGHNGIAANRRVPAAVWQKAAAMADAAGVTPFMLCHALGVTVMNALGAGEDLAIGAAVANRLSQPTEDIVGLLANVIVVRSDLSGDPTPRTLLGRVRETSLDSLGHQGVPFERLVETLNPKRSLARNPLCQAMMHLRDIPVSEVFSEDGATTYRDVSKFYEVSFMDFHFDYQTEGNGDLVLRVIVNPDLYTAETGQFFVDAAVRTLEAFIERPDTPLSELNVLPGPWDTSRSVVIHRAVPAAQASDDADDAPVTDTERTLIALLEELLEIDDVARTDGFFELGGDSVIAIAWATRAGQENLPLTPQMVFENFTIVELAAAVDEAIANPPAAEEVPEVAPSAPMSVSGLGDDALAALKNSFAARK